jgi:hypothetical protein
VRGGSNWQTYSYQAGEAWRAEDSTVLAVADQQNSQHPDLEDLQTLFASIHEKAVAAGALQSAAIDPALDQEQVRLDQLLTQLRQQETQRPDPVLVANASPSPGPLWTSVPHSPSAEVDPLPQPLPPQQVTHPQPPQIEAPSAVNRERARLEQVLAELRQEKSSTSPPQTAPPLEIPSPVVQRPDPVQPVTPREDGTVILTPSLEQTQPLELLTEPLFTAPPLSDLPSTITDVPETQDQLLQPQPFLGQLGDSDVLPPLRRDTLIPFPETVAILPPEPEVEEETSLSPLQRPMTRLFGFETASSLHQGEVILRIGANTFGNPQDFRTVLFDEDNRGNDIRLGFDVGLTDQLQFSLGAEGKDDTIFANIFAEESGVSFIYQGIPAQLKWRLHEGETLSTAVVLGAQFAANTVPGNSVNQALSTDPASRKLILTTDRSVSNALLAEDSSIYYSRAVPVSYQVTPRIRVHANPQVSVFPDRIPVTNLQGDAASLVDAGVGFDGQTLDYFGTVVGLGLGLDYDVNELFKFSADVTPILSGSNMLARGGDDSLFVPETVFNAGVRWSPNSRLGVNLYLTNRCSPTAASPANLLAQVGGDTGIGLDFLYLPDLLGTYEIEKRDTYPEGASFLSGLSSFPSTTLPLDGVIYEVAYGTNERFTQTARFGVLDDLEIVLYHDSVGNDTFPREGALMGRLALQRDRGRAGVTGALALGLLGFEGTDGATDVALYAELPLGYRARSYNYSLGLIPKLLVPTQASGRGNTLGVTVDGRLNLSQNTQLLGSFTPILSGDNQLRAGKVGERALGLENDVSVSLYSLGVRQLFATENSLYALDLFVGNSAGTYGQQGLLSLPNQENQVGVRLNVMNGTPTNVYQPPGAE